MEKRLIDAIELVNHFALRENAALISRVTSSVEVWARAKWLAQAAPTIDAVEVVRCKDCVHRHSKLYCPRCDLLADMSEDEGFCNLGARGDSDA